jgi:PAS domain S-box-containing protein
MPWRRSLRARLVAYFLLLSAVTVALVGASVYVRASADLTTEVYERLSAVAEVKADSLDRWVDEQRRNVAFIGVVQGFGDAAEVVLDPASTDVDRTAARDLVEQTLSNAVQYTSDAAELLILDLTGTIRVSTRPEHEGRNQSAEPYFQRGSSITFVQNAYASPLTGETTITVSTPLFDTDGRGRKVGVLVAHLNLERIDRIVLERSGLGETGNTYLVGLDHRFLHARLNEGLAPGAGASSVGIDAALAGQDGQALYVDYRGQPVIGLYRWLDEHDAALLVELGQDEALAPARQLALLIAAVGLASAALLAFGIWFIARRVTRPILALASTASRVAAGDLDARADITAQDEVGTLADAFGHMTTQLRENVETLERRVEERTIELSDALTEVDRQKQYFESLVEVSPVAVVTMDPDERVSAWNPAATRLFGYPAAEAIGHHIDELILRTEELRDQGHDIAREAVEQGRAQRVARRMRKDGTLIDVEVLMVPLVIGGEMTGFYAIYHDITELEEARRGADAANQAKSSFLAAMSHEIRTPMNAVIGMSGLLLGTRLDATQRDYAESISTSADALLTIINDILDFSKIEAGRIELESVPFDAVRTVRGAVDVVRPLASSKGLEVRFTLPASPPPLLLGDPGRIRQIVLNLLSNAVKFTPAGGVEVKLACSQVADAADGARWAVSLSVHDSGVGISPEAMGRLFQSFSQADASISRRYGGTGLGLVISRRLAELMGGSLTATSAGVPGEGSTFELAFEAAAAPAGAKVAAGFGAETGGAETDGATPDSSLDSKLRILLAEDNAMNQKLALRLLEQWGLTADVVHNGEEAVAAVAAASERDPYDIILMDVEMPELDGLEATRRIRAAGRAPQPWIVAMTASAMEGDREVSIAAGMDDYVTKPIRPDLLRAALVAGAKRG